jgi:hypothetical protein
MGVNVCQAASSRNTAENMGIVLSHTRLQRGSSLGRWVMTQRSRHDELDSDRISRLESIGFIWELLDHEWEDMFAKLA